MLIGLPLAAYALLFFVLCGRGRGWRDATMLAATAWGVLVVLITELLSFSSWLTKARLAFAWLVIGVAALIYLRQLVRQEAYRHGMMRPWTELHQWVSRIDAADLGLLRGASVILAVVGVVGLLSPPNTWDVMAYHMPRVVHWMQNHHVAFYPTHEPKQLHMPPWAEFAMLHLHALAGSDSSNNLVQWFSLFASVVGVTLLAQSMGAGHGGQVLAAVICATLPQGLL